MPFPPSLTTRVVTGRFVTYPDGAPARGTVRIGLNDFMQGPTDKAFVEPFEFTITLVDGAFSVILPTTDDPQWTPSSLRIVVTTGLGERIFRANRLRLTSAETGPLDLTGLVALPPAPVPGVSYVLVASKGVANGVASLGSDGKVPASQLPTGSGGSSGPVSWLDLTDKPAFFPALAPAFSEVTGKPTSYPSTWTDVSGKPLTFTPATHSHPTSDVTGLDTALSGKANTSHTHAYNTLTGIPSTFAPSAHSHVTSDVTGLDAALTAKAPVANPTFTGTPTAPTAATGTNTTQIATTAFVAAALGPKVLVLNATAPVPDGTPSGTPVFRTAT